MTDWIDERLKRFGYHIADRIVERTGLDRIAGDLTAFLLGLNGTINEMFADIDRDA
ncbi:MAG: hypothetical protein ACPGVG_12390 [Mycobacterium sp.]